ncbi:unnamed protein product [Effrenium voratum]|nr:unnamed protein product [Effrenium voratum]|mmetsp:Transcript_20228/g.47902  ORF Transcript_20228/g.47902 Transcript_20228/m.47902 type:complete len:540 (-) Transcript_20228:175-1794(-)|eukprot:CAMPEP_0181459830 /NCGR_PEP_ID=MMETSP1110-20121109/33028_1 /TAXON_ID=174948 /ORGANISM="Symbiodinium sp., Strain CCMP421" /LENGTH=539 /DNA_ID=CAMNT_0023584363 /DNA_START=14 /DNA_END=1633 /DNA_ORIENTATION=-
MECLQPPPPARPPAVTPPPRNPQRSDSGDDVRKVQSAPPTGSQEETDPMMAGRHSKLYQRRKEVEAELRNQFNLPEEAVAVLSKLRSRRSENPYGCPPPVPKPRISKSKLPPIPKPFEQQHARWGLDESPEPRKAEAKDEPPWWKLEQENLARRNHERESHLAGSEEPRSAAQDAAGYVQGHLDRSLHKRPQSWRMRRPEQNGPADRWQSQASHEAEGEGFKEEPWQAKAKELEEIAMAHRRRHEELKRRRAQAEAEYDAEAREAEDRHQFGNVASRGKHSQEYLRELRHREEQRFEEMRQEEMRKLQRDRDEARKRRQEQEEWEKEIRRQFAEEAEHLRAAQSKQQEVEEEQQRQWQEGARRQEAEREERRRREAERHERHRARQAARRAAQAKADQSPEPPRTGQEQVPPRPECRNRHDADPRRASSQPPTSPHAPPRPVPPPPAPGRHESRSHLRARSEQVFRESRKFSTGELQAAKSSAMRQLQSLKQNPSREARQKGFKDLLRMWHPDKNPESSEIATAVFQMIQAERSRVLPK